MKMLVSEIKLREMIRSRLLFEYSPLSLIWASSTANAPTGQVPLKWGDIAGKKFAGEPEGEPLFVVVAANYKEEKAIITKYSQASHADFDKFKSDNRAKMLSNEDSEDVKVMDEIIEKENGWMAVEYFIATLKQEFENYQAHDEDETILSNLSSYYMIDTNFEGSSLKRPKMMSTAKGKDNALRFKCAMSLEDIAHTVIYGDPKSENYYLAAACCFQHVNNPKLFATAAFVGIVAGIISGGAAGGSAFALTSSATDFILRIPVAKWAHANNHKRFLTANVIMMIFDFIPFGAVWAKRSATLPGFVVYNLLKNNKVVFYSILTEILSTIWGSIEASIMLADIEAMLEEGVGIDEIIKESSKKFGLELDLRYPDR